MRNLVRVVLCLMGLGLMVGLVLSAGPASVWNTVVALGLWAPLALIPYAFVYLFDSLGWRSTFPTTIQSRLGFWQFARSRWAGEATNYILPTAYLGGEALKIVLLQQKGVLAATSATSAVTSKTCQTIAQVIFLALGASTASVLLPPESPMRLGMIGVTGLAVLALGGLFLIQRQGFYRCFAAVARRLHLAQAFLTRHHETLNRIDRQILGFYRHSPRRLSLCVLFYLLGWMADTLEIWLVSHLIDSPISWSQALAIESFVGVAKILGMFVPGSLGIQETGVVGLCHLFGLPIVFGTAYALLRRLREVAYATVGWILLSLEFPDWKRLQQTISRAPTEEANA